MKFPTTFIRTVFEVFINILPFSKKMAATLMECNYLWYIFGRKPKLANSHPPCGSILPSHFLLHLGFLEVFLQFVIYKSPSNPEPKLIREIKVYSITFVNYWSVYNWSGSELAMMSILLQHPLLYITIINLSTIANCVLIFRKFWQKLAMTHS